MSGAVQGGDGRISTGIAGLDEVLGDGLDRRRIYLVEGDAGSGKTTLGLQYLLEGKRRGESGLYITLTETREELEQIAWSHGWSLDGITIHELATPQDLEAADQSIFHPSEVELGETARTILDELERVGPARVAIDSLGEMRLMAQGSLRFRRQVLALKQAFQERGATPILLDEQAGEAGDPQLRSVCHGVLRLEHLVREYGGERRRLRVIKLRARAYVGGYHDFAIRTGGIVVFPRLVAASHRQAFEPDAVPSGIDGFDEMIGGGLDRGTSTLVIGPAGAGKSVLCSQIAAASARRGEPVIYFSFDEGLGTLIGRSEQLGLGMQALVDAGRLELHKVDPTELSPGEFAQLVLQAVAHRRVRLVVIDSLNGYLNAMAEERMLALHLHELLAYLGHRGVVTLLVMGQHGLVGATTEPPADVSYLADAVLLLRAVQDGNNLRRTISMVKRRGGAYDPTVRRYRIAEDGLAIDPQPADGPGPVG
jgi:circadian clock protein KaiC